MLVSSDRLAEAVDDLTHILREISEGALLYLGGYPKVRLGKAPRDSSYSITVATDGDGEADNLLEGAPR